MKKTKKNPPGRPKIGEVRDQYLRVRFSGTELAQIKKSAQHSGARYEADWVRERLGLEPTSYGKG